ncbi:hypothetical protein E2320_000737 [Naja naja]|nr:hypothetical protein E2320_000737 [Naja naja]
MTEAGGRFIGSSNWMDLQIPPRNIVSARSYNRRCNHEAGVGCCGPPDNFVCSDSNEDGGNEPTIAQKFEKFQREVQTFVDNLGEKTKAALREFHNSEFSNKTRSWLSETFQKLKKRFEPISSQDESD